MQNYQAGSEAEPTAASGCVNTLIPALLLS